MYRIVAYPQCGLSVIIINQITNCTDFCKQTIPVIENVGRMNNEVKILTERKRCVCELMQTILF